MEYQQLPHLNALLNGTCFLFLIGGYAMIRKGRVEAHRFFMSAALLTSVLFLTSYLVYHAHAGSRHFEGAGAIRAIYLTILVTHSVLAAVVPPLAVITLVLALKKSFETHKKIARITLPIWLYVSVTGVIVYYMLYQM